MNDTTIVFLQQLQFYLDMDTTSHVMSKSFTVIPKRKARHRSLPVQIVSYVAISKRHRFSNYWLDNCGVRKKVIKK